MAKGRESILWSTPLAVVIRNIAVIYAAFFICHPVFILYNWNSFENGLGISTLWSMAKGSLVFDTAGIMYLCAPYIVFMLFPFHFKERIWYYKTWRTILIILVCTALCVNMADTVYFPYTGCRSTLDTLAEMSNEGGGQLALIVLQAILSSWYLVLLYIAMVWLLCRLIKLPAVLNYRKTYVYYIIRTILTAVSSLIIVAGIRGGLAHNIRPITMSNAYQYADNPAQAAAILNTPFCAIRTLGHKDARIPEYFDPQTLDSEYSPVIIPDSTAVFRPKNVVVLILESFGSEYIGAMNPNTDNIVDCTPFLDSLIEKSLTFTVSLANGRKSIDAMPSVLSGIPMLRDHLFLTSTMMSKQISGLAGLLGRKGYYSAFFHGADNGSMGFQSFARATGFKDYFGMDEFLKEPSYGGKSVFDGYWAIWDEEFLQFMCNKMSTFREPFAVSAFTASSHHPYNVPERYSEIFPNQGNLPIYHGIRYSDNALRLFFEKASREPWFNNTLFVLTADHTNLSEHPEYQSDYGRFRVPIVFYSPADSLGGRRDCIAQQSDILPSVLGYLGYDMPYVCFGQNLFATPSNETWAANYENGLYTFYQNNLVIRFDGENQTGLFDYRKDPLLRNNLIGSMPQTEDMMTRRLKAIIQQYLLHMNQKPLVIE